MSQALTQNEIDRLLGAAAPSVDPAASEVVPFRFARPPRLPAFTQRRLESLTAEFARALGDTLTGRFRVLIETRARGVEVVHARDAVAALGTPCAAFRFEPRRGHAANALLDLGAQTSLELVERVFGGPGGAAPERRALTALEQGALAPVVERALERLAEVWQGRLALEPRVTAFAAEPELLTPVLGDADQVVATIELRFAGRTGFATLAVPFEEIARALGEDGGRSMQAPPAEWLAANLARAEVTMSARLPVAWLDARRIGALAVGDVIELGHPAGIACELEINGRVRFRGQAGQNAGRLALRITEVDAVRRGGGPPRPGIGRRA